MVLDRLWYRTNCVVRGCPSSTGPGQQPGRSSVINGSGSSRLGGIGICLCLTGALLWPPRRHPGQHVYTFVISILSMSLISVSIFSVCCCSRYLSLWLDPYWSKGRWDWTMGLFAGLASVISHRGISQTPSLLESYCTHPMYTIYSIINNSLCVHHTFSDKEL